MDSVKWIGRSTVIMDGWTKYGKTHAFTALGGHGEDCISICGKLDLTNDHDCEGDTGEHWPECKACQKKMEKHDAEVERPVSSRW